MPDHPSTPKPIRHHLWFSDLHGVAINQTISLDGQEAHHAARVKRIKSNEIVGLLDGKGTLATGTLIAISGSKSSPTLQIQIQTRQACPPISPNIEIYAALPKADRLDRMIDQLTQLGVNSYRPLLCDRSQRKPDSVRIDKLERIAREATKQCHRPWTLNINDPITFADAIKDPDALVADALGQPLTPAKSSSETRQVILIGPEGGWSEDERDIITATNAPLVRFGVCILRIEAAACAASAIALSFAQSPKERTS